MDNASSQVSGSAHKALDNLDINLEEINDLNNQESQLKSHKGEDAPNELILSEIHGGQEKSSAREELAEMEQMLKQGVFPKDLSGTFKKVRQEMGDDFDQIGESPSQPSMDGVVDNQIQGIQGANHQTSLVDSALEGQDIAEPDPQFDGESAIDMEGLTESEMQAL